MTTKEARCRRCREILPIKDMWQYKTIIEFGQGRGRPKKHIQGPTEFECNSCDRDRIADGLASYGYFDELMRGQK